MPLVIFDIIIACVVFYLCHIWEKRKNKQLWIIILSIMVLVYGLRYDTATDYINYVLLFYRIRDGLNIDFETEPGYMLLNNLFISTPYGFTIVLFLCSFLSILLLMIFMTRHDVLKWGLFLCFCFELIIMFNNQVRQGVALAIFLYASKYITEKKFFKYLLFVVLAMMFHTSALITLFYYPMIRKCYGKPHPVLYIFSALLLIAIFLSGVLSPFLSILFTINEHYERFQGTGYAEADSIDSIGPVFLFNLLVYFYILINRNAFSKRNEVFYNLSFVVLALYCIFGTIPLMERLVRYLYAFEYVGLSIIISNKSYQSNVAHSICRTGMMIGITIYAIYCSYANNYGGVYKTVFSDDCKNHVFYVRKGKNESGKNDRSSFETYNLE